MKYKVPLVITAGALIEIETEETDPVLIAEEALDTGEFPTLCATCSGLGQSWSLDLDGEWQPIVTNEETGVPEVYPADN